MNIENINEVLIPINVFNNKVSKNTLIEIKNYLNEDYVIIIFPSGEVLRLKGLNIVDSKWNKGAVYFARNFNAPILPVFLMLRTRSYFI